MSCSLVYYHTYHFVQVPILLPKNVVVLFFELPEYHTDDFFKVKYHTLLSKLLKYHTYCRTILEYHTRHRHSIEISPPYNSECAFPTHSHLPFLTVFVWLTHVLLQCLLLLFCCLPLFICRVIPAVLRVVIELLTDFAKHLRSPVTLLLCRLLD